MVDVVVVLYGYDVNGVWIFVCLMWFQKCHKIKRKKEKNTLSLYG